jgi:antitoxin component of MazEF toxin-antitoxin module
VEYHVEDVRAYETGKPDSLVVVIPKSVRRMLNLQRGTTFHVKVDRRGRIIYEQTSDPGRPKLPG